MLARILTHLGKLVALDTQNPPRAIGGDHAAIAYCASVLGDSGCAVEINDLGGGSVNLLARRGSSGTLVNCHLDTVPVDPSWTRDPFSLSVESDRAIGLGACDIKGGAACLLAAIESTAGPAALLLTSDEEAGKSACVHGFLGGGVGYDRSIVAEPTGARAVTRHRGLATFEIEFAGSAAHSSVSGADRRNAVHLATRWCARALDLAGDAPFDDIRLNLGVIEGGTKPNVAASSARVVFGMRPPPGMDLQPPAEALRGLIGEAVRHEWRPRFAAPGLDTSAGAESLIDELGFERGGGVDFWTEAALFARAGLATVVLGPGDIRQAHAPDEFVMLEDLERAAACYARVFGAPDERITRKQAARSEWVC